VNLYAIGHLNDVTKQDQRCDALVLAFPSRGLDLTSSKCHQTSVPAFLSKGQAISTIGCTAALENSRSSNSLNSSVAIVASLDRTDLVALEDALAPASSPPDRLVVLPVRLSPWLRD
jgi:hypothetical protein